MGPASQNYTRAVQLLRRQHAPASAALLCSLLVVGGARADELAGEDSGPVALLVMDLESDDLDDQQLETISGLIASDLARRPGLRVMTSADMRDLLSLEESRELAGCDDDSCMSEIAGALGARYVVFGQAGKLGDLLIVNLKLLDTSRAETPGRAAAQARDLEELPGVLRPALDTLVGDLVGARPMPIGPWVTVAAGASVVIIGAAVAGFGVLPLLDHNAKRAALQQAGESFSANSSEADVAELARLNRETEAAKAAWNGPGLAAVWGGAVLSVVGLGAVGGGVAWLVLDESAQ